jgi:hypothetical protein
MSEPYFSEEEKIKQGHSAFRSFFDDLGPNSIYKKIVLEEFFKLILSGNYDLSLPDEERQEGCETSDNPTGNVSSANESDGPFVA